MLVKIDTVEIDSLRIKNTCTVYSLWKRLNDCLRTLSTRGANIPSEISENIACYCLGYKLNKGSGGDALTDDGQVVEIKCCSVDGSNDLTSFSPKENFDKLIFCKLDKEKDCMYVWDTGINSEQLKLLPANKKETVGDQQRQKRRPHISIFNTVIIPKKLNPICKFDIINQKVIKPVRETLEEIAC